MLKLKVKKKFEYCNNDEGGEGGHSVQLAIACVDVDKEEGIAVAAEGEIVAIYNVHMNFSG